MGNLVTIPAINVGPINQPNPPPTPTSTPTPPVRVLTCPSDFVTEGGMCRAACGPGYTYSDLYCRHNRESSVKYYAYRGQATSASQIINARNMAAMALLRANTQVDNLRLSREAEAARRAEITGASAAAGSLAAGARLVNAQNQQFNNSARLVRDTTSSLRIRRPPVQPETEIPKEQRRIQQIIQKNALFIQIVLALVFACAVSYLVLPMETANYVSLAILSVALIYRFFFIK